MRRAGAFTAMTAVFGTKDAKGALWKLYAVAESTGTITSGTCSLYGMN
jgi:hypothetical protein